LRDMVICAPWVINARGVRAKRIPMSDGVDLVFNQKVKENQQRGIIQHQQSLLLGRIHVSINIHQECQIGDRNKFWEILDARPGSDE